ncbi:hypothetical protein C5167_028358 [Papaver somniferum]|uniref:lanC-like protein GCR2 isoform X1 n=1 Tax=Papaver somniferum TaxID=3469 RepID=UPI000E6FE2C3|nr:lanC-like protein GCR2 isoform X1 [Papaver somniferum]RZC93001.1 hypothetical protein C5167_028358 [Papaver somniferum]
MADRFFANEMPEFIDETSNIAEAIENSLLKLLSLPYSSLSEKLKEKALGLKETIVRETWGHGGRRVQDFTVYTGSLGIAYLLFKSYQVTHNKNDLTLCSEIVQDCDTSSKNARNVTFLCGRAGVCALGAVAAKHSGDERLLNHYLTQFQAIKLPRDIPNELLYGRAGFLWAYSFLNKHITGVVSSSFTGSVVKEIIEEGRRLSNKGRCPLMYEWHGKKYWGAAHGLAGIVHVLMDMELKPDEVEDVKGTLRYMIQNRFPSGNYPSSEESESDRLVHWCHGSPGVALTLVKAAQVFGDQDFLRAAIDAGEVVWERGLLRRVGICHGVSGNAYVFLSLYRLTGNVKYLFRAKSFACFLFDKAEKLISEGKMHGGDHPYSLFEGLGGMTYLFLDMTVPAEARFPGYEL